MCNVIILGPLGLLNTVAKILLFHATDSVNALISYVPNLLVTDPRHCKGTEQGYIYFLQRCHQQETIQGIYTDKMWYYGDNPYLITLCG